MRSYLDIIVSKTKELLGPLWKFVPSVADDLKLALAADDVETVRAISLRLRAIAASSVELADHLDATIADGSVSLSELAQAIETVEDFVVGPDKVGDGGEVATG